MRNLSMALASVAPTSVIFEQNLFAIFSLSAVQTRMSEMKLFIIASRSKMQNKGHIRVGCYYPNWLKNSPYFTNKFIGYFLSCAGTGKKLHSKNTAAICGTENVLNRGYH